MSYQLTLTQAERKAFDWVGDRYNSGQVQRLLEKCLPKNSEWSQAGDITFNLAEHIAWEVRDLAEQENFQWPCFAATLATKLNGLCFKIV